MNRAVEWKLNNLTANEAGKALLLLIEVKTKGFEKYKEHYFNRDDIPDPTPLFKYAIRLFYNFSTDNRKATLFELKEPKDPYRTVSFWWFNGRFEYDSNRDAYVPVKITRSGSETMRKLWAAVEQKRIKRAWRKARDVLQGKDRNPPKLVTEPE